MKLLVKGIVHNFDMYSDWLYLLTVPAYTTSIKVLIATFIGLPIAIIIGGGGYFGKKPWTELCAMIFGLLPLYDLYFKKERYLNQINNALIVQGMFFSIEDGP